MTRRKPRLTSPAFTLVELLVVIAIIALLIAMLLPVLKNARAAARTIECGSRMKNFAIWMEKYRMDNVYFPSNSVWGHVDPSTGVADPAKPGFNGEFVDQMQAYMGGGGPNPVAASYYVNTLGDTTYTNDHRKNFFLCPGSGYVVQVPNNATYIRQFVSISWGWKLHSYVTTAYFGYGNMTGWNGSIFVPGGAQGEPWKTKRGDLRIQPASLVWLGEIVGVSSSLGYYGPGPYALNHLGRTNLMMADGHVGTFDQATIAAPQGKFRFY